METLSYATLERAGYRGFLLTEGTERVLQFGEGNFLRAFVDYFIDILNERENLKTKVVAVQPNGSSLVEKFRKQDCLYTHYRKGISGGENVEEKRIISCISRCLNPKEQFDEVLACAANPELRVLVSNTTEAGIVFDGACGFADNPPASFPAKLTRFLYERFLWFGKEQGKGFVILPCELIDDNGPVLKETVLRHAAAWNLDKAFADWVERENIFCSTLVDSIVTGYPFKMAETLNWENGYVDYLMDVSEPFASWLISCEGENTLFETWGRLIEEAGLPIRFVDDCAPYKERKVRILNGGHTGMALAAYLAGKETVGECMQDEGLACFLRGMLYEEVIPTLSLAEAELTDFAKSVEERFSNPFVNHSLLDISLNSISKWRVRVLPSLLEYEKRQHKLPKRLVFSFAALLAFYRVAGVEAGAYFGKRMPGMKKREKCGNLEMETKGRAGGSYELRDDVAHLAFLHERQNLGKKDFVAAVCQNRKMFGRDLSKVARLVEETAGLLAEMERHGIYEVMKSL